MNIIEAVGILFNAAPVYTVALGVLLVVGMPLYIWAQVQISRENKATMATLDRLINLTGGRR